MKNNNAGLSLIGLSVFSLMLTPAAADVPDMTHKKMTHHDMTVSDLDMPNMNPKGIKRPDMVHDDHKGMAMSDRSDQAHNRTSHHDMTMSNMDHSSMNHSDMDMSGMQGGEPPADARDPDYSNGVGYGEHGKPVMMGSLPTWGIAIDDLGYQFDEDQIRFVIDYWYGDDSDRLFFRTEGHAQTKDDNEISSLTSLSYWKPLGVFWNGEAGVAYDTKTDNPAAMVGIVGTAPYFIETDARAYLYTDGQVRLDLSAQYEWRLDQRWVVIPEVELTAFSKDDTDNNITSGFNEMEADVRLAYEMMSRQLAPYVGVSYERALSDARDLRRQNNESVDSGSVTAGIKFWF